MATAKTSLDPYAILGVSKDADGQEIKAAYKRVALATHPDKHPGCEKQFREAAEAYAILSDAGSRAAFDADAWAGLDSSFVDPSVLFGPNWLQEAEELVDDIARAFLEAAWAGQGLMAGDAMLHALRSPCAFGVDVVVLDGRNGMALGGLAFAPPFGFAIGVSGATPTRVGALPDPPPVPLRALEASGSFSPVPSCASEASGSFSPAPSCASEASGLFSPASSKPCQSFPPTDTGAAPGLSRVAPDFPGAPSTLCVAPRPECSARCAAPDDAGRRSVDRGPTTYHTMEASLEQLVAGFDRTLRITRDVPCPGCRATDVTRTDQGCGRCRWTGASTEKVRCRVRVPPGTGHGHRFRLSRQGLFGKGLLGRDADRGDIVITIAQRPHQHLARHGDDLWSWAVLDRPVGPGDEVWVPYLRAPSSGESKGVLRVSVPCAIRNGDVAKVAGKGARPSGNLYVIFKTRAPATRPADTFDGSVLKPLSDDERRAYGGLQTIGSDHTFLYPFERRLLFGDGDDANDQGA